MTDIQISLVPSHIAQLERAMRQLYLAAYHDRVMSLSTRSMVEMRYELFADRLQDVLEQSGAAFIDGVWDLSDVKKDGSIQVELIGPFVEPLVDQLARLDHTYLRKVLGGDSPYSRLELVKAVLGLYHSLNLSVVTARAA